METGMLWFDDDQTADIEEKVLRAAAHYTRKYDQSPNLCFVHLSAFNGNGKYLVKKAGGVNIRPSRSILPDHFWIGMADREEELR